MLYFTEQNYGKISNALIFISSKSVSDESFAMPYSNHPPLIHTKNPLTSSEADTLLNSVINTLEKI